MRKLFRQIHLVLGLLSGIVLIVVCLTGCIYIFKDEIEAASEPFRKVKIENSEWTKPAQLIAIANEKTGLESPSAVMIGPKGEASYVEYALPEGYMIKTYHNPYTGNVIKVKETHREDFDFFSWILRGHRSLWLPTPLGKYVVSYSVLIFLITLLTGLFLWVPRRITRKSLRNSLKVKWPIKGYKGWHDLHNILGFYCLLPLIVASVTGLIYGIPWFSQGLYSLLSGGEKLEEWTLPQSTIAPDSTNSAISLDKLYNLVTKESPEAEQLYFALPRDSSDCYRVSVVHQMGSYYKQDNLFFNQYTLKELKGTGPWAGHYQGGSNADKIFHMTLDLHEGRVFGIVGRIIMFFASLVGASLPITGFILWRRRTVKGRNKSLI